MEKSCLRLPEIVIIPVQSRDISETIAADMPYFVLNISTANVELNDFIMDRD